MYAAWYRSQLDKQCRRTKLARCFVSVSVVVSTMKQQQILTASLHFRFQRCANFRSSPFMLQGSGVQDRIGVEEHELTQTAQKTLAAGGGLGGLVVKHLLQVGY